MNTTDELELKKEFQLERIILFSDAVFAIIVTIMVIELKFEESAREATMEVFKHHHVKHVLTQLLGYGISFFFVAMLWTRHVKLFGFLKDYNTKLLTYNLLFLFCVSLFPFAVSTMTMFINKNIAQAYWGFDMYVCEILLCMFMLTLLTGFLIKNKEQLAYNPDKIVDLMKWKAMRANFWLIPLIGIGLFVLNYYEIAPKFSAYIMAMYGVSMALITNHHYPKPVTDEQPFMRRIFGRRQKKSRKAVEQPAGE